MNFSQEVFKTHETKRKYSYQTHTPHMGLDKTPHPFIWASTDIS